jgi:hypothetical protein
MQHSHPGDIRVCVCCEALACLSVLRLVVQVALCTWHKRWPLFKYRTNHIELAEAGELTCFDAALVATTTTNTTHTTYTATYYLYCYDYYYFYSYY